MSVFQKHPSLRHLRPLSVSGAFLAGSGLLLSGCPSGADLENADQQVEAHSQVEGETCDVTPIFVASCGLGSVCHESTDGGPIGGGVDLIAPGVEQRLLDVAATYPGVNDPCTSAPRLHINSAAPEESYLWKKITNTQDCGSYMPLAGQIINSTERNCVWKWMNSVIANGAGAPGSGGAAGTGGDSGSGGDAAGTGGDAAGTGGDAAGTGGDAAGTGGAVSSTDPIRVEAECAFEMGCADGVVGSYTMGGEGPQLEASQTAVGYMEAGVALIFEDIPAAGLDTLTLSFAQAGGDGVIEIRQDTATGTLLGTVTPTDTGDWAVFEEETVTLSAPLTGTTTIVLVPVPDAQTYVANVDWFELSAGSAQ